MNSRNKRNILSERQSIILSERGVKWLSRFDESDQIIAARLAANLTLVSGMAFERSLERKIIEYVSNVNGPVALFATREMDAKRCYFEQARTSAEMKIDALPRGIDIGSEARIATMIRSLQRAYPNKIISHPDLEDIRALRPRAIVLIDDFIGSGKRSLDFINSMWICKTMKSWISLKYLNITVLTYSGTYPGLVSIQLHPAHPKVIVDRYCPSLSDLPWSSPVFQDVKNLCERYGHRINQKRFALGFRKSMGTMVFEHGCPNNAPAILWYDEPGIWNALFPMKTVTATEKAFFPSEIEPPPAEEILTEIGEKKLAHPGVLSRVGPAGRQVILILGLLSKGVKSLPALSFATGLSASGVAEILTRCMTWNFINKQLRLTRIGYSELRYARSCSKSDFPLPDWSEESYHPRQLRKITHG